MFQSSMLKSRGLFYFVVFICGIAVDQISKNLFAELISVHYNEGIIFGSFVGISPFVRISLVSSFFGIIFSLYLLSLYMISEKSVRFKLALSLFVSGMGGNVYSKVLYGKTIDFMNVDLLGFSIYFNIADIFQWLGFILCFYFLIIGKEVFWHGEERRGGFFINIKEQISYSFKLCLVSLCSSLILGVFSFTFMRTIFDQINIQNLSSSIYAYILTYILISLLFMILVGIAGIFLSRRIVGPIFAFERFVDNMLAGKSSSLQLRKSDRFKDLERIADKLKNI